MSKKKVEPVISEHFRKLALKGWEKKKRELLEKAQKEELLKK